MTDKPIIFRPDMIRALLDGRKTQTRRMLRYDKCGAPIMPIVEGDRLWVREAHALVPATAYRMSEGVAQAIDPTDRDRACIYREGWERSKPGPWRSPIHMPRWASRLTLVVTDVRVQRVQEISEADARAEGAEPGHLHLDVAAERGLMTTPYRVGFRALWDSIHGPDAWDKNPWVQAIAFTVHKCNIDQMEGAG